MYKHTFSYCIGAFLSGIFLVAIFKLRYVSLLFLLGFISIIYLLLVILVKKTKCTQNNVAHINSGVNKQKYSSCALTIFSVAKIVIFCCYFVMLLIPIKKASITEYSLLPLIILCLMISLKITSRNFSSDEYKIASWETELSSTERMYLYKSLNACSTISIFPILSCCFYGHPIIRVFMPFFVLAFCGFASRIVARNIEKHKKNNSFSESSKD